MPILLTPAILAALVCFRAARTAALFLFGAALVWLCLNFVVGGPLLK